MPNVVFQISDPEGKVIPNANVLATYPNATYLTAKTHADGKCQFNLYRTDQEMRILVAAEGYLPFNETVLPGNDETICLELKPSKDDVKAILFMSSTGYIPGIEGRLNPHRDRDLGDRGYVYGNNISINGHLATPAAHFKIGEPLHIVDVYGVETTIKFLVVEGQFSLIEYTEPKAYAGV